jgi:hypothetical protein
MGILCRTPQAIIIRLRWVGYAVHIGCQEVGGGTAVHAEHDAVQASETDIFAISIKLEVENDNKKARDASLGSV